MVVMAAIPTDTSARHTHTHTHTHTPTHHTHHMFLSGKASESPNHAQCFRPFKMAINNSIWPNHLLKPFPKQL